MNTQKIAEIITTLSDSVNNLEYTVIQAYDSFLEKYGAGHACTMRLEMYFDAIDKQRQLINELEDNLKSSNLQDFHVTTNKISAISDMIKSDARNLFFSLGSTNNKTAANEDSSH